MTSSKEKKVEPPNGPKRSKMTTVEQDGSPIYTIHITKRKMVWLSVVFALIATSVGGYQSYRKYRNDDNRLMVMDFIGTDGMLMFEQHDRDKDGYLSIEEFEPLAHMFHDVRNASTIEDTVEIDDDDEILTVLSYFKPLRIESMTKNLSEEATYDGVLPLPALTSWTTAHRGWLNFGVRHFNSFIPTDASLMERLGEVYPLVQLRPSLLRRDDALSSNRYYSPQVSDENLIFHQLLWLFHPRPFIVTRFPPRGGYACVRAYNDDYIDIVFRFHAEFQLSAPPEHPFWFTPGQFSGNLVIARDGSNIVHFHMLVPTSNLLNVDMEWLTGPNEAENMEVDIGFMDQMELNISAPSRPVVAEGGDLRGIKLPYDSELLAGTLEGVTWTKEISREQADDQLATKMFEFKKVKYYKLTKALEVAQSTRKLVHLIMMWGALDDQSC